MINLSFINLYKSMAHECARNKSVAYIMHAFMQIYVEVFIE